MIWDWKSCCQKPEVQVKSPGEPSSLGQPKSEMSPAPTALMLMMVMLAGEVLQRSWRVELCLKGPGEPYLVVCGSSLWSRTTSLLYAVASYRVLSQVFFWCFLCLRFFGNRRLYTQKNKSAPLGFSTGIWFFFPQS